jgi:hypothetical protein
VQHNEAVEVLQKLVVELQQEAFTEISMPATACIT